MIGRRWSFWCLFQANCPANERANLRITASLNRYPGSVVAQCCQSGNRSRRILESAQRLRMTSDTNIDRCGGATSLCGLKFGYERLEDENGGSENSSKD